MNRICKVEGCTAERRSKKKDYCGSHDMRMWRYGDPLGGKFKKRVLSTGKRNYREKDEVCSKPNCFNKVLPNGCKGMCVVHYGASYRSINPYVKRIRKPGIDWSTLCSVDDCEKTISSSKGYCGPHLRKLKKYGDVNYVRPPAKSSHILWGTWCSMRRRCDDENNELYGGRGIYVCERWNDLENGFENFLEDMGERPEGMTLDRKDNDGPYSPENTRWATPTVQNNNKNNNFLLEYNGVTKTIAQWSRVSKVSPIAIRGRLKLGWSVEEAILTPVHVKGTPKKRYKALDKPIQVV